MRTKLVCTLGPSTDGENTLREMIRAGMTVARLNFSHGKHEDHAKRITMVRRLSEEMQRPVTLMGDLQGPKFRVGDLPISGLMLAKGQEIVLTSVMGADGIPFPHKAVIEACKPGQKLLVDDGNLVLETIEHNGGASLRARVLVGGLLTSRKGVSAPGTLIAVSSITSKDREDVVFAIQQKIDALALSFVQRGVDVIELRELLKSLGANPLIVSKIEKPQAIQDLSDIIRNSDVIMVARGDLGVESAPEDVPFYQKRIIRSCLQAGVPVITATQMLQSMVHAPTPTRAEASDVANAVLDGSDAVMLSAETASGEYPVESVQTLARIAKRAEDEAISRNGFFEQPNFLEFHGMPAPDYATDAITQAAVRVAHEVGAKAIVCTTSSGFSARMVSRHRPDVPIIGVTPNERAFRYSAFMWGVQLVLQPLVTSTDELFEAATQVAQSCQYAAPGDSIVITAGVPMGSGSGHTNMIKVHTCK